jgi:hypothetical protein
MRSVCSNPKTWSTHAADSMLFNAGSGWESFDAMPARQLRLRQLYGVLQCQAEVRWAVRQCGVHAGL